MSWARFDDKFDDDPDCDVVGELGIALFICSITWVSRNLTDGFVPEARAKKLPGYSRETVDLLLSTRWWTPAEGGYMIRNFLKYNPSREQVLADREANAKRQRDFQERERQKREEEARAEQAKQQQAKQAEAQKSARKRGKEASDTHSKVVQPVAPANTASSPVNNADINLLDDAPLTPLVIPEDNAVTSTLNNALVTDPPVSRIPYSGLQNPSPTTTTSLPSVGPDASDGSPPSGEDDTAVVVASLREWGVSENFITMLIERRGVDACRKQAEWLPARIEDRKGTPKAVRDPAALLVKAIEDGYAVPTSYSQAKQRKAEETRRSEDAEKRNREAVQQAEADRQIKEAGKARLAEAWEALPPEERQKITEEASAQFVLQLPTNKAKLAKYGDDPQALPLASRLEWERLRDGLLIGDKSLAVL